MKTTNTFSTAETSGTHLNFTFAMRRSFKRLQKVIPGGLSDMEMGLGICTIVLMLGAWAGLAVSIWEPLVLLAGACMLAAVRRKVSPALYGLAASFYLLTPLPLAMVLAAVTGCGAAFRLRKTHTDGKPQATWALDALKKVVSERLGSQSSHQNQYQQYTIVTIGEDFPHARNEIEAGTQVQDQASRG